MKSIEFTTAQHVKIEYEIASSWFRMLASIIDLAAFMIYFLVVGLIFGLSMFKMNIGTQSVFLLILFRIPWMFYSPIIEYLTRGQSLGKYVLGIRVVKVSGENAGLREYFTRWIFRIIDLWLGFGFLAMIFSSTSPKGQRLGDMMANTVVINKKSSARYSLNSLLKLTPANHVATYHQVTRFTDEDMMLIKLTIQRLQHSPSEETKNFAIQLANKTAQEIGLKEVPAKKVEFLKNVLTDYVVLTR